jgi:hypothetical protein
MENSNNFTAKPIYFWERALLSILWDVVWAAVPVYRKVFLLPAEIWTTYQVTSGLLIVPTRLPQHVSPSLNTHLSIIFVVGNFIDISELHRQDLFVEFIKLGIFSFIIYTEQTWQYFHLLSDTNKCTNYIIYYLKSV